VPPDAVVRAGLAVGRTLDRETARALGRELRRAEALGLAVRALRHRDRSRRSLEERLAARGTTAGARADALAALERAGLVDDARFAASRARSLAERGYGDAAIRGALAGEGIEGNELHEALAALEPETDRALRFYESRGGGPKALRWLATRGFDAAALGERSGFADEV
jgi:regulatory protein